MKNSTYSQSNAFQRNMDDNVFGCVRMASNSVYMPKSLSLAQKEEFYQYENSPSYRSTNRANSPAFCSSMQREMIEPSFKAEIEQSLPESTDADSDVDSFDSHVDAIDELSEIFETASNDQQLPNRSSMFARPSNPIVRDTHFAVPRCAAPAPVLAREEMSENVAEVSSFSCPQSFMKSELETGSYNKPRSLLRPTAINNLLSVPSGITV